MNGGEAIPVEFTCPGTFNDDTTKTERRFSKAVNVSFFTDDRARLEIKLKGGGPQYVDLNASLVQFRMENEPPKKDKGKSHFHAFGNLNDPATNLTDVTKKAGCTEKSGTVHGCANSAWP